MTGHIYKTVINDRLIAIEGLEMQKWNILLTGWWEKLGHLSSYNICFKSYGH